MPSFFAYYCILFSKYEFLRLKLSLLRRRMQFIFLVTYLDFCNIYDIDFFTLNLMIIYAFELIYCKLMMHVSTRHSRIGDRIRERLLAPSRRRLGREIRHGKCYWFYLVLFINFGNLVGIPTNVKNVEMNKLVP